MKMSGMPVSYDDLRETCQLLLKGISGDCALVWQED